MYDSIMKKLIFRSIGKTILALNPFLWNLKGKFWFEMHQALGAFVININHKYDLNLWTDED